MKRLQFWLLSVQRERYVRDTCSCDAAYVLSVDVTSLLCSSRLKLKPIRGAFIASVCTPGSQRVRILSQIRVLSRCLCLIFCHHSSSDLSRHERSASGAVLWWYWSTYLIRLWSTEFRGRLWRVGVLSAAVVGGEAVLISREKESASGETAKLKRNNSNRMCSSATPPSNVGWVKAKKHNLPVMHNLSLLLLVRT